MRLTTVEDSSARKLATRWTLVETAFDAGIGRSLISNGVMLSPDGELLLERVRRAPVASARPALVGFQHGRCFYCHSPLETLAPGLVHVDHVHPYAAMTTGSWCGPDLNKVWNLVVACAACNTTKADRLPTEADIARLIARNEAILTSPHPLRRAVELLVRLPGFAGPTSAENRRAFYVAVDDYIRHGGDFATPVLTTQRRQPEA